VTITNTLAIRFLRDLDLRLCAFFSSS